MKYKEEIIKAICQKLENGLIEKDAAILSGIGESTYYEWKNEKQNFRSRVEAALAIYREKLIKIVNYHSIKDGKLALDILARRWPEEFAAILKHRIEDPHAQVIRILRIIKGEEDDPTIIDTEPISEDSQRLLPQPVR